MAPKSSLCALFALSSLFASVFSTPTTRADSVALTGDTTCNWLMCIDAVVNGTMIQYTLRSTGKEKVGWMAMGRGTYMGDSAHTMVVLWTNPDGSVTMSQRTTTGEQMPRVDPTPARPATLADKDCFVRNDITAMSYTMAHDGEHRQKVIWAFGSVRPASSAVDEDITIHLNSGNIVMDVSIPLDSSSSPTTGADTTATTTPAPQSAPMAAPSWRDFKMVIMHAVLSTFGFLVLLPAGVLLARYLRTTKPAWFRYHWLVQFAVAGPVITLGVACGAYIISAKNKTHLHGKHTKYGVFLFVLYLFQCALGAFIHFIKFPKNSTRRPPQNYVHAIVGLATIGIAFYQVRGGYKRIWKHYTKLETPVDDNVDVLWWCWVVALPVLYGFGLKYLPKQLEQERKGRGEEEPYKYVALDDLAGVPDGEEFRDDEAATRR